MPIWRALISCNPEQALATLRQPKPFGSVLGEVMAEGMISLSALADDYYDYFPERQELLGRGTRQRFYLGRSMKVRLVEANLRLLEINLEPVAEKGAGRRGKAIDY